MYQIKELLKYKNLVHGISTMEDGNMSFKFGIEKEVVKNRKTFFRKINIKPEDVVDMGPMIDKYNKVVVVKNKDGLDSLCAKIEPVWGDALIVNKKNYFLAISFADCFGIIFYEPKKNILALVHAGYTPVSAGIISIILRKLKKEFKIDVRNLVVAVTPGIGDCCLKREKLDKPVFKTAKAKRYISKKGKFYHLDLLKWILDDLKENGIFEVVVSNFCSACSKIKFYSHKKQQEKKQKFGRNILTVGMK